MLKKTIALFIILSLVGRLCLTVHAESQYDNYTAKIRRDVTDEERHLLYDIGWAEAEGEGKYGIIRVINVIFNRLDCPNFPGTIHEIVFQPRQFSPVWNGRLARAMPCQYVKDAVQMALNGVDYSQGALFFRAVVGAEGSWHERALTRLFDYGGHRFYK